MTTGPPLVTRMAGFGTTIFAEMSALAADSGAINLGQGFPDTDGPPEIREAAVTAIREGRNQYPPGPGIPELREAVAAHQQRCYGLEVDPGTGVLVTAGATEALAAALLALAGPGDEVLAFDPTYDSYGAGAALGGARLRTVSLRDPDYGFDPDELAAAVTPATRVLLLNSPHNPTGKVFDAGELEVIARLCVEHDLWALTDEVYEHLTFDGRPHLPLATFPGMAERTLTVSSAGKMFSLTGWKIGWVSGPSHLVAAVRTVKQYLTYVSGGPFQHAIAHGLGLGDGVVTALRDQLAARRDRMCAGLRAAGFAVRVPQGTYFVTADIRPVGGRDGLEFCRSLPHRAGVVAVPCQVFYDDPDVGRHLVRFAFCKGDDVIDEACRRLARLGAGRVAS